MNNDSYLIIASAFDQVQDHCNNNDPKNAPYIMRYVTFGPFSTIIEAETWAEDYVLGHWDLTKLVSPDDVINWEDTEPKYKCTSCGRKLHLEGSCRCTG